MALKVVTGADKDRPRALLSDRRLYLDRSRERVVEEGSLDAAFLLASAGGEIGADEAARLQLYVFGGRICQGGAEQSAPAAEQKKKARRPRPPKKG